eukprot:6206092-Pleurochrysis_carterae.AAC.1
MAQDLGLSDETLRAAGEIAELEAEEAGASTTAGPSADSRDNAESGLKDGRSKSSPPISGSVASTTASQLRSQWYPNSEQVVWVRGHGNGGKGAEAPSCGERARGMTGGRGQYERGITGAGKAGQDGRGGRGQGAAGKGTYNQCVPYNQGGQFCQGSGYVHGAHGPHA